MIALIVHSCWRLCKLRMDDRFQWAIAVVAFAFTVIVQAEVAAVFLVAGTCGILYYGSSLRSMPPAAMAAVAAPLGSPRIVIGSSQTVSLPLLAKLGGFFLKAGSLAFGSGLVIVAFLQQGLVRETNWLNPREFLVGGAGRCRSQ